MIKQLLGKHKCLKAPKWNTICKNPSLNIPSFKALMRLQKKHNPVTSPLHSQMYSIPSIFFDNNVTQSQVHLHISVLIFHVFTIRSKSIWNAFYFKSFKGHNSTKCKKLTIAMDSIQYQQTKMFPCKIYQFARQTSNYLYLSKSYYLKEIFEGGFTLARCKQCETPNNARIRINDTSQWDY